MGTVATTLTGNAPFNVDGIPDLSGKVRKRPERFRGAVLFGSPHGQCTSLGVRGAAQCSAARASPGTRAGRAKAARTANTLRGGRN
jgi:hypothetical protein